MAEDHGIDRRRFGAPALRQQEDRGIAYLARGHRGKAQPLPLARACPASRSPESPSPALGGDQTMSPRGAPGCILHVYVDGPGRSREVEPLRAM